MKAKYSLQNKSINVRLKEEDYKKIELKAKQFDISISEYVRKLIL